MVGISGYKLYNWPILSVFKCLPRLPSISPALYCPCLKNVMLNMLKKRLQTNLLSFIFPFVGATLPPTNNLSPPPHATFLYKPVITR